MPADGNAWFRLFDLGIQYYIAGRAATMASLVPVSGNLLHHAVEMLLKGEFAKRISLADIRKKYGHNLVKTWETFKSLHPTEGLSDFDELIADLDRFELIRYPDVILKKGAAMSLGFVGRESRPRPTRIQGDEVPAYTLPVKEVDSLVAKLFTVCHINPKAYLVGQNDEARRVLLHMNSECDAWLG
jgi:hypothetical protein